MSSRERREMREHAMKAAAMEEQIAALERRNAELREERDHWHVEQVHAYSNWEDAHKRAVDLEDENAKLRELVRDMYKAFMHGNCYRWCEFKVPCNYISDGRCQWYDRMRELGVEVDA